MTDQLPSSPLPEPKRPRRRLGFRGLVSIGLLAIAIGLVWRAYGPTITALSTAFARTVSGPFTGDDSSGLTAHAGSIQAENNMTTATANAQGDHAHLACRTMVLICQSDHPLAQRVAKDLLARLKKIDSLQRVDYLSPGERPQAGVRMPDVFVTLKLASLTESGLIDHTVDAQWQLGVGNSPIGDSHTSQTHLTPPTIEFHSSGLLKHHSVTRELGTPSTSYKLVAENVAEQLAGTVTKLLGDFREKFGLLPELPAECYPAFEASPELPLSDFDPQLVFSGNGLLRRNETVWQCRTDRPMADVLEELQKRLAAAGFEGAIPSDEKSVALRMSNQTATLQVLGPGGDGVQFPALGLETEPSRTTVFHVKYKQKYVPDDRRQAIETLFAAHAPLDTLLLFEHSWNKAERRQIVERFQENPPGKADTYLTLAELYHYQKQDDQARDALRRAHALLVIEPRSASATAGMEQLAKKLDISLPRAEEPPSVETLRELGFLEIKPGAAVADVDLGPDQPANYFAVDDKGQFHFVSLQVLPPSAQTAGDPGLSVVQASRGSRSWTSGQALCASGSLPLTVSLPGIGQVKMTITKDPGQATFRVHAEVPAPPPTEAPTTHSAFLPQDNILSFTGALQ